jgi:hypothetical protein
MRTRKAKQWPDHPTESIPARLNSPLPKVQLPGDNRLLSAFADECAQILKSRGIYQRGGIAMIVNEVKRSRQRCCALWWSDTLSVIALSVRAEVTRLNS